jgi:hypothetical protein
MTIKDLYEWALTHNIEDYDVRVLCTWEEIAVGIDKNKLDVDHKNKKVIIND